MITSKDFPALNQFLNYPQTPPGGCSGCAFSSELYADNPYRQRNPANLDAGFYRCELKREDDVWGERPKCSLPDWQREAFEELQMLTEAEEEGESEYGMEVFSPTRNILRQVVAPPVS